MAKRRKHSFRAKHYPRRKPKTPHLKAGADARLRKTFSEIGVPENPPFTPDAFQTRALAAIEHSDCLVTAPTGAGKTWIAERAIDRIHAGNGKSWYACPLKALSNAKYAEFCAIFGRQHVGILTGDRKENPDASIIVGTTEILRNQLYDAMHRGEVLATDFVVLDEAHFLGDADRGVVWEEIMIYLPARIPLLLLSATIGNADQIASWLSSIRSSRCEVIKETKRPVPLIPLFLHPSGTLLPLTEPAKTSGKETLSKKVNHFIKAKHGKQRRLSRELPPFDQVLRVLKRFHLLPALFFLKSRADCDRALELCRQGLPIDPDRKARLEERIEPYAYQSRHIFSHRQRWILENLAIGSHHAGQLPGWKLILEQLMTEGLLDAVFATSTVAAGVNFPARTVVFLNSDRFNGTQFLPLDATEFHQMTGRAGRRGMDNIGFALLLPSKFMDVRLMARLFHSSALDVVSQIRINFSMVLNLLLSHNPDQIKDLLKRSFAAYLTRKATQKKTRKGSPQSLWRDFLGHLHFLKETGYVTDAGELTADGKWASQLRVDQPLMIAEGFRRGILPISEPHLLAAIIAAFVNERESDAKIPKRRVPKALLNAFNQVIRGLRPFARHMLDQGFEARPLLLRPVVAIYAWAIGEPWEKVGSLAEMEEGDLVMLILRTADNLRHIRALKAVFPEAAETAAKSIELISREPVVYEP
ncbi:MAG: DEAD/DEAH box helicase [Desulfobacterales bacterium]|jgi:superfamily II RNA helicase